MNLRLRLACRPNLRARIDFSRMLEAPEQTVAAKIAAIETNPLFGMLTENGVVKKAYPLSAARLAAMRSASGLGAPPLSGPGVADIFDDEEALSLIRGLGQEVFGRLFLGTEDLSDEDRAEQGGITIEAARRIREYVDRRGIEAECGDSRQEVSPEHVYSPVARVEIQDGQPSISFLNRDIWRARFEINETKRDDLLGRVSPQDRRQVQDLLSEVFLIERRKTLLCQVLEVVIRKQSTYLLSGDADQRLPLTQKTVAAQLKVCPTVIFRLISNKVLELPRGEVVPLKHLFPSRKTLLRDQVFMVVAETPGLTDTEVGAAIEIRFGVRLSRASIWQYRRESGAPRMISRGREPVHAVA